MSLSCSLFPNISSRSFRFSGFMPEYLIHLYFILVESEKGIIDFSVLYVDVKFSHTGFTEEAFVSQMCNSCLFSKNQVAMVIWEGDKRARNVIRVHYIYSCPYKVNDSILRMCSQEWTGFITLSLQNIVTTPNRNSAILVITLQLLVP